MTKSAKTRKTSKRATTSRASTAKKSRSVAKRKARPAARTKPSPPPAVDPRTAKEEAAYLETVIATGEAAPLDQEGKLPAGATHKVVEDESGNVKVVRRRYSMT